MDQHPTPYDETAMLQALLDKGGLVMLPPGTDKIDGAATFALTAQWKYLRIQSDGTQWLNLGSN